MSLKAITVLGKSSFCPSVFPGCSEVNYCVQLYTLHQCDILPPHRLVAMEKTNCG